MIKSFNPFFVLPMAESAVLPVLSFKGTRYFLSSPVKELSAREMVERILDNVVFKIIFDCIYCFRRELYLIGIFILDLIFVILVMCLIRKTYLREKEKNKSKDNSLNISSDRGKASTMNQGAGKEEKFFPSPGSDSVSSAVGMLRRFIRYTEEMIYEIIRYYRYVRRPAIKICDQKYSDAILFRNDIASPVFVSLFHNSRSDPAVFETGKYFIVFGINFVHTGVRLGNWKILLVDNSSPTRILTVVCIRLSVTAASPVKNKHYVLNKITFIDSKVEPIYGGNAECNYWYVGAKKSLRGTEDTSSPVEVINRELRFPQAVVFGIGGIGRGYLGEILNISGYRVAFIDKNEETVKLLNCKGCYELKVYDVNKTTVERVMVNNVKAIALNQKRKVIEIISRVRLVFVATHIAVYKEIAFLVAEGVEKRIKDENFVPVNIIVCSNNSKMADYLRELIMEHINISLRKSVNKVLGTADSVNDRIVPYNIRYLDRNDSLSIVTEPRYYFLEIDREGLKGDITSIKSIEGVRLTNNMSFLKERKLFSLNTAHAVCAYLGYLREYTYIHEAIGDPQINKTVRNVLFEITRAMVKKWHLGKDDRDEYIRVEDILGRFSNEGLNDPIVRVARNPVSKLGYDERLMGAVRLVRDYNGNAESIIEGVVAAIGYDYEGDREAPLLQGILREKGIVYVLQNICRFDSINDREVFNSIKEEFLSVDQKRQIVSSNVRGLFQQSELDGVINITGRIPKNVRLIVFDFDGVLVDTVGVFAAAAAAAGVALLFLLTRWIGYKGVAILGFLMFPVIAGIILLIIILMALAQEGLFSKGHGLKVDSSEWVELKNRIDENIMNALINLAEETGLKGAIEAMFAGVKINETEDRVVLHTALRNQSMESDGKNVSCAGKPVKYQTWPIIWGEPGTNGQHAFYQLIHQGTKLIPADFIAFAQRSGQKLDNNPELKARLDEHHKIFLSNFFAQTEALMKGKDFREVLDDIEKENAKRREKGQREWTKTKEEIAKLAPFKVFEGNRPTNSIPTIPNRGQVCIYNICALSFRNVQFFNNFIIPLIIHNFLIRSASGMILLFQTRRIKIDIDLHHYRKWNVKNTDLTPLIKFWLSPKKIITNLEVIVNNRFLAIRKYRDPSPVGESEKDILFIFKKGRYLFQERFGGLETGLVSHRVGTCLISVTVRMYDITAETARQNGDMTEYSKIIAQKDGFLNSSPLKIGLPHLVDSIIINPYRLILTHCHLTLKDNNCNVFIFRTLRKEINLSPIISSLFQTVFESSLIITWNLFVKNSSVDRLDNLKGENSSPIKIYCLRNSSSSCAILSAVGCISRFFAGMTTLYIICRSFWLDLGGERINSFNNIEYKKGMYKAVVTIPDKYVATQFAAKVGFLFSWIFLVSFCLIIVKCATQSGNIYLLLIKGALVKIIANISIMRGIINFIKCESIGNNSCFSRDIESLVCCHFNVKLSEIHRKIGPITGITLGGFKTIVFYFGDCDELVIYSYLVYLVGIFPYNNDFINNIKKFQKRVFSKVKKWQKKIFQKHVEFSFFVFMVFSFSVFIYCFYYFHFMSILIIFCPLIFSLILYFQSAVFNLIPVPLILCLFPHTIFKRVPIKSSSKTIAFLRLGIS
ncbi:MAG: hypothetical protein ABIH71_06595, partial [Candidatus Omnitrophota bacterium]